MNQQLPLGVHLPQPARFEDFVTGSAGEEALAAVRRLAAGASGRLLLVGAPGSGKSHLLQATTRAAAGALYLPLADLRADDLACLPDDTLLCLDDVESVFPREASAQALMRLLDRPAAGRLLLASRAAPSHAPADLATRLGACLRYALPPLDEDGQCEALRRRAAGRGIELPREVGLYLIRRLPRSLPRLLEALDALDRASLSAQRRLTIPFVQGWLTTSLAATSADQTAEPL
jgi:ATPase involved in DNA replication initiation